MPERGATDLPATKATLRSRDRQGASAPLAGGRGSEALAPGSSASNGPPDAAAAPAEVLLAPFALRRSVERLLPGRSAVILARDGRAEALAVAVSPRGRARLARARLPAGAHRLLVAGSVEGPRGALLFPRKGTADAEAVGEVRGGAAPADLPDAGDVVVRGAGRLSGRFARAGLFLLRRPAAVPRAAPRRPSLPPFAAPVGRRRLALEPRSPEGPAHALLVPADPRRFERALSALGGSLAGVRAARTPRGILLVGYGVDLPRAPEARALVRRRHVLLPRDGALDVPLVEAATGRLLDLPPDAIAVVLPDRSGAALIQVGEAALSPIAASLDAGAVARGDPRPVPAEAWAAPFQAVLGRALDGADEVLRPLAQELPSPTGGRGGRERLVDRVRRRLGRSRTASPAQARRIPAPAELRTVPSRFARLRAWMGRRAAGDEATLPAERARRRIAWPRRLRGGDAAPADAPRPVPAAAEAPDSLWRRLSRRLARALLGRFRFLRERAFGRHGARLAEVLDLFRQGRAEEALRRAVPLADELSGLAGADGVPGLPPPPRDSIDFRLADLLRGRGAFAPVAVGAGVYDELRRAYRRAAEKLLAQGRHRAAAYVYAVLLDDARAAAEALSRGGHHREAAVVFLEKAGDRRRAARELAACGDHHRAADLAEQCGEFESAAEYLLRAGDREAERACLGRWARRLVLDGRPLLAGAIYEERLGDLGPALSAYRQGLGDLSQAPQLAALAAATRCLVRAGRGEEALEQAASGFEWVEARCAARRLAADYELLASLGPALESVRSLPAAGAWLARALDVLVRRSVAVAATGLSRLRARRRAEEVAGLFQGVAAGRLDRLLAADAEAAVRKLPAPVGRPTPRGTSPIPGGGAVVHALCTGGGRLFLGAADRRVHVFELKALVAPGAVAGRGIEGLNYTALGVAADEAGRVVVGLGADGGLLAVEVDSGRRLGSQPPVAAAPYAVASRVMNGLLWAGDRDGRFFAFRLPDLAAVGTAPAGGPVGCLAVAIGGRRLAVGTDGLVAIYDPLSGSPPRAVRSVGFARALSVALSPTGRALAAAGERAAVFHWPEGDSGAASAWTEVALATGEGWTRSIDFSPDGLRVACGGFDRVVRVFEAESGRQVSEHRLHGAEILAVCFLPDGTLASSDSRGLVAIVDPEGPRLLRALTI